MSQTKRKKAEPRNLGDFGTANKQKPETKTVQELIELVCLRCSGSGHVPTQETANAILKSKWISEAKHRKGLAEKDKEIKKLMDENQAVWDKYNADLIEFLDENKQLKAVRDALGRSNKNALADRNRYIKRLEAIRKHYEKFPKWQEGILSWTQELGVLLSEPKSEKANNCEYAIRNEWGPTLDCYHPEGDGYCSQDNCPKNVKPKGEAETK